MGMRKLHILRRQGGIAKHFDLRAGITTVIVYADYIEPPLAQWCRPAQVIPHHLLYFAPLVAIHRRCRGFYILRRSRLNFHKTQNIVFPADQIDLTFTTRRTVVARHNRVAQLAQMKVSIFFATYAYRKCRGDSFSGAGKTECASQSSARIAMRITPPENISRLSRYKMTGPVTVTRLTRSSIIPLLVLNREATLCSAALIFHRP